MFTGIITHLGQIKNITQEQKQTYIEISSDLSPELKLGESVAIDGACLTVTELTSQSFRIQATEETLQRTNLRQRQIGSVLNLERAMLISERLDGHMVLGHVDDVGEVCLNQRLDNNNWILEILAPKELQEYLVFKGSVCINGVSLTISKDKQNSFEVTLIDYTLLHTNLQYLKPGDLVNLEIDVIARYLKKILHKQ